MRGRNLMSAVFLAFCWTFGCGGDGGGPSSDGPSADLGQLPAVDSQPPDTAPPSDSEVLRDQTAASPDAAKTASSMAQVVINTLQLAKDKTQFAVDLDGNGTKDNQFGALYAGMKAIPVAGGLFDLQKDMDEQVKEGNVLALFDLIGTSLTQGAVTLLCHVGEDLDSDPSDNFLGGEELGISPTSPNLALAGTITAGQLKAGPGTLLMPMSIGASTSIVTLKKGQVQATLVPSQTVAMVDGQLNGAIPMTDVEGKLYPAIAQMLTDITNPVLKPAVMLLMDKDKDGKISVAEAKPHLSTMMKADVDTDGDGQLDAMSIGMGFTAVKCKIKKPNP